MQSDDILPTLRAIEVRPIQAADGDTRFALIDRSEIAPQPVAVSSAGYFVLTHLDGAHTFGDLQAAFQQATGAHLPTDQVAALIQALDDNLMLDNGRFEAAYAERARAYAISPARDNRNRYPDAATLRTELEQILASGNPIGSGALRGLVAPHLDYERGKPCYAEAYATVAAAPPARRYIILGTNHNGRSLSAVATDRDFQTPLGLVRTGRDFIGALSKHLGSDACATQLDHVAEHSIELQVHLLQVVLQDRDFEIVPILCAAPPACWPEGVPAVLRDEADTRHTHFWQALRDLLEEAAEPTVVIAGADLSHVGPGFGDSEPVTDATLAAVRQADETLIHRFAEGDADAFVAHAAETGNPTRVCSIGCLEGLRRLLPDAHYRSGKYHQAVNHEIGMHVSCFAAAIY